MKIVIQFENNDEKQWFGGGGDILAADATGLELNIDYQTQTFTSANGFQTRMAGNQRITMKVVLTNASFVQNWPEKPLAKRAITLE
jgi:hypothetical protein